MPVIARAPRLAGAELLDLRHLRVDDEADRRRERRALRRLRQSLDAERPPDADVLSEDAPRRLGEPGQLARAAGQHDALPDLLGEAGLREHVARHLQRLLDARPDDAGQRRARHGVRMIALVLADRRDRQDVLVVGGRLQRRSVARLDALRVGEVGRESARDVERHVLAADRDRVGMRELALVEDRERGRAAAHVDAGDAELRLVVDEHREARRVGRGDDRLHFQMAAVDRELEIGERRLVGGHDMHVDAERLAEHADRIVHAAIGVERIADRQRMQHHPPVAHRMRAAGAQHALDVGSPTTAPPTLTLAEKRLALQPAAGEIDDEAADRDLGHALGRVDGEPDRALGLFEVDDDAGLDAARAGGGEAEHLDRMRAAAQRLAVARLQPRDQAADLGRADVEHADGHRAPRAERLDARHAGRGVAVSAPSRPRLALLGCAAFGGHVLERTALGQTHRHAVGKAEVDDDDIARQQLAARN